ncbi:MAG: hypothetical protein IJU43_11230 [Lachnospiraceae bacterium]|nr:hypothetical protein [Lachnospiraceae bacterium]
MMDSNDIELFSTTDLKAKDKVVSMLVRHRVSYLERWEKVSIFRRREYGGAKELCVIYVNGNQYGKAKKILEEFNATYAGAKKPKKKRRRRSESDIPETEAAGMMEQERASVFDPEDDDEIDVIPGEDVDDGIDDI